MEWMEHKTFDEERALYGKTGLTVRHCSFDGPADGESALKECRDVVVEDSLFNLRYPCWHDHAPEACRLPDDGAVPGGPLVLRGHSDHGHRAPRHQGPAGVR